MILIWIERNKGGNEMTEKRIQKKKPKVGIFVALSLVIVMISTMFMSPAQVAYGRGGGIG